VRFIHVSYNHPKPTYTDPGPWLKRIQFSLSIIEALAEYGEQIVFYHIQFKGVVHQNNVTYHFINPARWQLLFPFKLNRIIGSLNPDVVIIHGLIFPWQVFLLCRNLDKKVKVIAQHHAEKPFSDFRRYIQRRADRYIHSYLFASEDLGIQWFNAGQIQDKAKINVVMEASSSFYPIDRTEARSKTKMTGGKNYLWVGRLDANKDPLIVARAFSRAVKDHSEMHLYIIYQSQELEEELKAVVATAAENIHLIGKIDHDRMLYWYNGADFIVSSSHYEGSGIAVCEAMSCGCIPILTDIPSFRMMTAGKSIGLLYPVDNEDELVKCLHKSISLDIKERSRVLDHFASELSPKSIARKIKETIDAIHVPS
jgi:glycosyltransferase involved in cell wall biosynthesis